MARYAIVIGGVVDNVIQAAAEFAAAYATQQGGQAVQSDTAAPGDAYAEGQFTRPAAAAPVPRAVTMRQARLALLAAGLLDGVEAAIAAIPDATQRAVARITWDHSQEVQRNNGLVSQLAPALGLTGDQLDDLFRTAAGL